MGGELLPVYCDNTSPEIFFFASHTNFTKIYIKIYIMYAKKYTARLDVTSFFNI